MMNKFNKVALVLIFIVLVDVGVILIFDTKQVPKEYQGKTPGNNIAR